jgi:hypothetical protein
MDALHKDNLNILKKVALFDGRVVGGVNNNIIIN